MKISCAVRWAALLLVAVSSVRADEHLYVKFARGKKESVAAAVAQGGGRLRHDFGELDTVAVVLPDNARAALARNPNVLVVEEDPIRQLLGQTTPYGIDMVQAPAAVKAGATGAGIRVGVIDSGVYAAHEDLQSLTITGEPDFGPDDQRTWYRDNDSHGTHVVGTIAAANNGFGVIGVSPGAIAIHMVKVFGDTGQWVYSSDLLAAARAAASKGCKIISMSLGGGRPSKTEQTGLDALYSKGVLLIAAAGNDGNTTTSYPAGYASVVSVAAIDAAKAIADFSQQNSDVELAAPGVDVLSTVSYIDESAVTAGRASFDAKHIEFAARGTVTASLVYGGLGDATNSAWAGKVVLVDRGSIDFNVKVQNVQASGGVGCVIANNDTANPASNFDGTLSEGNTSIIPAVSISYNDGLALRGSVGSSVTLKSILHQPVNGYDYFNGTSMATPHVSAVAALIWSKYPGATNVQVRQALDSSAEDLGSPGRDVAFGFGLVRATNALTALAALNPTPGNSDTTAPVISALTATSTNSKNGSFQITWTTNEAATSDVTLNGASYPDPALVTTHTKSFRGTRGATYTYTVASTDAAGNTAISATKSITLP